MAPPTDQTPQQAEDVALVASMFDDEQTSTKPRNSPPTKCSKWGDKQSFRVWWMNGHAARSNNTWICVASFFFLSDCLEYIASCQDKGVDVVYQSPAHTKLVKATDDRVVYKAPQA